MTTRECVLCLNAESAESAEGDPPLLRLPCEEHFICGTEEAGCLESLFRQAMTEERSYPARCCNAVLSIEEYGRRLPFEVEWGYRKKELEYSVPPR
jgi:hypothetical protein